MVCGTSRRLNADSRQKGDGSTLCMNSIGDERRYSAYRPICIRSFAETGAEAENQAANPIAFLSGKP